jgi:hypothetical protein
MPIAVSCTCGKSFRAKDELAGKRVRCPSCTSVLTISSPAPAPTPVAKRSAEDEALAVLMSDPPPREEKPIRRTSAAPALPPPTVNASPQAYGFAQIPETNAHSVTPPFMGGETRPATKPKKSTMPRPAPSRASSEKGFFADFNMGGVIAGLLTMLGGGIWLGLGLLADRIFIYAIVIIVLGFIGMVKSALGFSSNDD